MKLLMNKVKKLVKPMGKILNLIVKTYGSLTVIKKSRNQRWNVMWNVM